MLKYYLLIIELYYIRGTLNIRMMIEVTQSQEKTIIGLIETWKEARAIDDVDYTVTNGVRKEVHLKIDDQLTYKVLSNGSISQMGYRISPAKFRKVF